MIERGRHGEWALIVGASEGLGPVFADRLAAEGISLVLLARSEAKLAALAEQLRDRHAVMVRTCTIDLLAPDVMGQVAAATTGLEIGSLIYVAGAADTPNALVDQPAEDALATIRLNVIGQTLFARHFGKGMAERRRGAILLVGSLGCVAGSKQLAVYTASKAYTQIFAEGLWAEMEPLGVDVAALLLGRTRTPALERSEFGRKSDMAIAEPAEVVDFALSNLQEGPVIVPPDLQQSFEALRSMPRRKAVKVMTRSLESQTSRRPDG